MGKYQNIKIKDYDDNLKGLVVLNKKTFSLNNVIVGEDVDIETSGQKEKEKIEKVKLLTFSQSRIKPRCEVFLKCGGCTLQHISYATQLEIKQNKVSRLYSKFKNCPLVLPTIGMAYPFNYRNKSQVTFSFKNGMLISGFYEEKTHNIINFDHCYLQDERANEIFKCIKELMIKFRITAFNEDKKTGIIRHVLIKSSKETHEILVVLVTSEEAFPGKNNFIKALCSRCKGITSIVQNFNSRKTSVILGEKEIILYGKGYITDRLLGKTFKITSKSFYQINIEETIKLYSEAIRLASLRPTDVLLDAYCGVGTIGILSSAYVKKVIGVELVKSAVDNAIANAKLNNVKNITFFNQDATNFIINLSRSKASIDVVIMDPPRSGSTKEFLTALKKLLPRKIVYISCNPNTQVEDILDLIDKYDIKCIQPVDMFPQTEHIEVITLLELKSDK